MMKRLARIYQVLGVIQTIQWVLSFAIGLGLGGLAGFVLSFFAQVPLWELTVCGALTFVVFMGSILLRWTARAAEVDPEDAAERLRFYRDFQEELRDLLREGQDLVANLGPQYNGTERRNLRMKTRSCVQKYQPEAVEALGDGTTGLECDVSQIHRLINQVEQFNVKPLKDETAQKPDAA
jgi:hypothetical protein